MPFALALTVILGLLAAFQLALALGAPLGRFAWGGQERVLPTRLRVGSAATILIYAIIVTLAWDRVGALDLLAQTFSEIAMWFAFAFSALGILMNAASRSKPERTIMTPTSIVLAGLTFLIAMGYGELAIAG